METAVENEVTPSKSQDPLAPYRNEEFVLLINNKELLKYIQLILKEMLKFPNVSVAEIGLTKQKAVENVAKVIMTKDAHVLLNPPLKLDNAQHDTDLDAWDNFLVNVKTRVEQTKGDKEKTLNCMSKIATVLTAAENYQMREKYVRLFAGFRIPSVFFFPRPASDKPAEQVQEISLILKDYLVELLSDKSSAIEKIKASEEEAELSEKKKEVDKLMAEGEKHKQDRNYEAAVQCFEQAIRILPQDPDAYLESGQGNTKLKNYRKALRRFGEAEEIAQDIPASNREIGNVKMIQAKELIEQGEDEDSEKVKQLLNEAKQNFKTALGKAEKLKSLGHDDKIDRSAEAVSEITRSISEHGLSEKLGAEHGIVKELSVMVSESLEKKGIKRDSATLSTPDRITLGLVAADNKEYDEAEKMLFQSAEDKKYLKDACWGINYLGAQVRQHGEVDHAFEIYQRLLTLDPPNKGAVYFNLAVAWNKRDNYVDSASSLIQAIYVDPSLPHDEMFKQNLAMSKMLKDLVLLFGKVENNEGNLKPIQEEAPPPQPEKEPDPMYTPQPNERYAYLRNKFEELLKADKKKAMKAIYYFASKEPGFFKSAEIYGSQLIMSAIKRIYSITKNSENQTTKKFTDLVAELIEVEKDLVLPSNRNFKNIKEKLEKVIKRS